MERKSRRIRRVAVALGCALVWTGCLGQEQEAEGMTINRFDRTLLRFLDTEDMEIYRDLVRDDGAMLGVFGKGVLNQLSVDGAGFVSRLTSYYSEANLRRLYREAVAKYDAVGDLEEALGRGFGYLSGEFAEMSVPKVYFHVSGLNQNILVSEGLLSVSIDKYMGENYPLYYRFFSEAERRRMERGSIVSDCLTGWLMSEFPFVGDEGVLLERMVYEGKLKYVVSQALPEESVASLLGYTPEECAWCEVNEARLWEALVERKQLYTSLPTTDLYFSAAPATFLFAEAPGIIGAWLGWQIVRKYVEATGATLSGLMEQTDAQEILSKAGYKQ